MKKKKRLSKRALTFLGIGLVLALVGAGAAGAAVFLPQGAPQALEAPTETATPTPTPAPFVTPTPAEPVSLPTSAPTSDAFDWWRLNLESAQVQFLASDEAHDGATSLVVSSTAAQTAAPVAVLQQSVSVSPGETVTVSFWAKATNAAEGAVSIPVSLDGIKTVIPIPGGTYDWTLIKFPYKVPGDQGTLNIRLTAQGPTEGTWIDSLAVLGASGTSKGLNNADFENSSADLAITNKSLLLTEGEAQVDLVTRRAPEGWVHWTILNEAGDTTVASGDELIASSTASIDLSELPVGYYQITFHSEIGARISERSTTIAVVTELPEEALSADSPFGIFLHYNGGQPRLENLVNTLSDAGVRHARVEIPWDLVEKEPGVYTYPEYVEETLADFGAVGIDPLLVPAYYNPKYDKTLTPSSPEGLAAYANYSADVVEHYSTLGKDIEVYNEYDHTFNNGACGRTPQCYMEMLKPTHAAVKALNPDAVVAAPGNAGMGIKMDWLQEFFELGGLQYTDVVSAHPYTQPEPPEVLIDSIGSLQQMIKDYNGGESKPVWLTEMGWATVPDWVTETEQAEYFVRTMALSLGHGVSRVYWFEAANLSLTEDIETNFGLFDAPSSFILYANAPKPAAIAQAVMARQIAGLTHISTDATAEGVYSYVFGATKQDDLRVMWAPDAPTAVTLDASGPVSVTGVHGEVRMLKPTDGIVTVDLSGSPVYVGGDVEGVEAP